MLLLKDLTGGVKFRFQKVLPAHSDFVVSKEYETLISRYWQELLAMN
jgi:hypothetical protein